MSDKQKLRPLAGFLRAVCFLCLFALLFQCVSGVLRPRPTADSPALFYDEPRDSLDVLFFGSSHMLNGVSPVQLYEEYGIPSYNLGQNGQVLPVTYYSVMDALRVQKPKVVVVDAYKVVHDTLYDTKGYLHTALDWMPLGPAKLRAVFDLLPAGERAEFLADIIVYHSRWDSLKAEDFLPPDGGEKGTQTLSGQYRPYDGWSVVPEEETAPPVEVQICYLEKIVRLCRDKGAEVLLVALPYSTPADDDLDRQAVVNSVAAYAEDWGVPYVNLMHRVDELDFRFEEDLADVYHLNEKGQRKVTAWLGEYLRANYGLPDRRGDAAYRDWDALLRQS